MNETQLSIQGYHGEAVPHVFYQQEAETDALAVLFPGYGYHADLPVLYYPGKIVRSRGMDLLRMDTAYSRRAAFRQLTPDKQEAWYDEDASAALDAALEQRPYRRLVLIGKSLGTLAMAGLLSRHSHLPASTWIWLTPVLRDQRLVERIERYKPRSLFAIGSADQYYDEAVLNRLVDATQGELVIIPGADHSLEVGGDALQSMQALAQVITGIEAFIA